MVMGCSACWWPGHGVNHWANCILQYFARVIGSQARSKRAFNNWGLWLLALMESAASNNSKFDGVCCWNNTLKSMFLNYLLHYSLSLLGIRGKNNYVMTDWIFLHTKQPPSPPKNNNHQKWLAAGSNIYLFHCKMPIKPAVRKTRFFLAAEIATCAQRGVITQTCNIWNVISFNICTTA